MTKFKVLRSNRKYMTYLGIYSNRLTEPTNEFFKSFFTYYLFVVMAIALAASGAFVLKYPSEVKPALGAFKICFSAIQCLGMFLGIGIEMIKVKNLHLELQRIVDEDEDNSEVNNIYWECEQKCRKRTQRFTYFVVFHTSSFTIVLVYALICIAFGNYDTSSWHLSFFIVVPFDRTKVLGWLMTWIIQFSMALCYALCMTSVTSYFVSCCHYINAMVDHINLLINSVETDVEHMQTEKIPQKVEKLRQKIIAQLCNIIKFHSIIYEISNMLVAISSGSIFALLPSNAIFLSISMYDIEVSVTNFDSSALLWDVSCILCALFWPAFISYYATHTTDRVSSIEDMVYNSNWRDYPPELRKYIILIIARSQRPVYFNGLGVVGCTLQAFGDICRASSSYYITFRAIDRR